MKSKATKPLGFNLRLQKSANNPMQESHYKKDPAFLSRPKTGESFDVYKQRIIKRFAEMGWLSPGKDDAAPLSGQHPDQKQQEPTDGPSAPQCPGRLSLPDDQ